MSSALVVEGTCGMREVAVRMGGQRCLSQECEGGACLGRRALLCCRVSAWETATWRCPAGS